MCWLAHWRFRDSETVFTALMVGCFIPFQVVLLPMARLLDTLNLANTTLNLLNQKPAMLSGDQRASFRNNG